jgi:hypothetical protein
MVVVVVSETGNPILPEIASVMRGFLAGRVPHRKVFAGITMEKWFSSVTSCSQASYAGLFSVEIYPYWINKAAKFPCPSLVKSAQRKRKRHCIPADMDDSGGGTTC